MDYKRQKAMYAKNLKKSIKANDYAKSAREILNRNSASVSELKQASIFALKASKLLKEINADINE